MMNPIVGNLALEEAARLGRDASTEKDRVRCHLRFALSRLRAGTEARHPPRRAALLRELSSYAEAGRFPSHNREELSEMLRSGAPAAAATVDSGDVGGNGEEKVLLRRAPRFVDSRGTPCAVAHLLRQSDGAEADGDGARVAAAIASNGSLNRAWVDEIASDPAVGPDLGAWCDRNGLSPADLALIQPTYQCVVVDPDEKCRIVSALSLHWAAAASFLHLWMTAWKGWSTVRARAVWTTATYLSIAILLGHQWGTGEWWRVTSLPGSALWGTIVLAFFFVSAMGAEAIGLRASWRSPFLCVVSVPVTYVVYCGLVSLCRESIEYVGNPSEAMWNWIGCRDKKECYSLFP